MFGICFSVPWLPAWIVVKGMKRFEHPSEVFDRMSDSWGKSSTLSEYWSVNRQTFDSGHSFRIRPMLASMRSTYQLCPEG